MALYLFLLICSAMALALNPCKHNCFSCVNDVCQCSNYHKLVSCAKKNISALDLRAISDIQDHTTRRFNVLDLSGNNLRDIRYLSINNMMIVDASYSNIYNTEFRLSKTTHLDASHNNISSIHITMFIYMYDVEYVDLSYNQITQLPAQMFYPSCKLNYFFIDGNPMFSLKSLSKALANLTRKVPLVSAVMRPEVLESKTENMNLIDLTPVVEKLWIGGSTFRCSCMPEQKILCSTLIFYPRYTLDATSTGPSCLKLDAIYSLINFNSVNYTKLGKLNKEGITKYSFSKFNETPSVLFSEEYIFSSSEQTFVLKDDTKDSNFSETTYSRSTNLYDNVDNTHAQKVIISQFLVLSILIFLAIVIAIVVVIRVMSEKVLKSIAVFNDQTLKMNSMPKFMDDIKWSFSEVGDSSSSSNSTPPSQAPTNYEESSFNQSKNAIFSPFGQRRKFDTLSTTNGEYSSNSQCTINFPLSAQSVSMSCNSGAIYDLPRHKNKMGYIKMRPTIPKAPPMPK